jgi:hypothetical protein
MNAAARLGQLRTFLFALAASLFAGTILELLSVKHYKEPVQLIPFALCGLGLVSIAVVWSRPGRTTVLAFRVLMLVIAGGSGLGVYMLIKGNYEFAHEIHPRASTSSLITSALTGRDPLMAPGTLAIGAAIAIAATFATVSAAEARSVTAPGARTVGAR